MRFYLTVGWRNLWRHKRRSLITAVAMAVGMAMCMATIAFQDGMFDELFEVMVEQQLGHVQVHHPDYPTTRALFDTLDGLDELVAAVDALPGTVASAPRLDGFALIGGDVRTAGGMLRGLDPVREAQVGPLAERVTEGRFLAAEPAGEVVLGEGLAKELGAEVGSTVVAVTQAADGSLGNELYTVVGHAKTGNVQLDKMGALVHISDLQRLLVLEGQAHGLTILTSDATTVGSYVDGVRDAIGSDVREVQPWWEASPMAAEIMGMRDASAFIILGIVFSVAAFGILNTMLMSVFERTVELGVLRALGMRRRRLVMLIMVESALLSALASVIGLAMGGALDAWVVIYGFDMSGTAEDGFSFAGVMIDTVVHGRVRPEPIVFMVIALFAVSLLASLWPAVRAALLRPVEAIRSE